MITSAGLSPLKLLHARLGHTQGLGYLPVAHGLAHFPHGVPGDGGERGLLLGQRGKGSVHSRDPLHGIGDGSDLLDALGYGSYSLGVHGVTVYPGLDDVQGGLYDCAMTTDEILNDNQTLITAHWQAIEAKKASFRSVAAVYLGLAVSVSGAAIGAALTTGKAIVAPLAIVVVLAFWSQHAYYLRQTRLFRALGDDVSAGRVRMRDMNTKPYRAQHTYRAAATSKTVLPVYAVLTAVLVVAFFVSL